MAKPILIVRLKLNDSLETVQEAEKYFTDNVELCNDYHIIFISSSDIEEEITFEVLNAENIDPITIDELKEKVEKICQKTAQ